MSTTENNVNPNSSSAGWFSWIWGAKRGPTAVLPGPIPPAPRVLSMQEPPASPVAPEGTGGDSSPDFVNDTLGGGTLPREGSALATPLSDAEPQDLPAVLPASEAQSPVSPDGHSAWHDVGSILGLGSGISPQKGEGEEFSRRCGYGSAKFRAEPISLPGGAAAAAAAAPHLEPRKDDPEHPSSKTKETASEIKKEQLRDHDKKMIRYRNYILVTSTVISTLGLGFYILWSKRSQDGSFDFTGISNAPHFCTDFLKSFFGTNTSSLSPELGFGDCPLDSPPRVR